jgi:tetratricopeptide (TPR) repeat protein
VLPLIVRIENAFVSYIAYIGKMIWPSNLAVFYPYLNELIPSWRILGSVFLLIAITVVVIWRAKRSPYLATGWLWYIGTLVPVIGILQVGAQAMADRYTYVPLIGLFIIVAWGVPYLLKKWNHRKEILLALSALSILCLSIIAWTQVGYWQNSITLWNHTLKVTDYNMYNTFAYNNRGVAYASLGNYRQAIEDFNRVIEIKPDYAETYLNRGLAYDDLGNYRQAIEDFNRVIEIKPGFAEAYLNRGLAYNNLGNYRQAIEDYNRAIEIKPGFAEAYLNRGLAYASLGNYRQAIEDYGRAIEIKPGYAEAYNNRGNVYRNLGNYSQAIEDFNKVIEIKPGFAEAYINRGSVYINLANYSQAIEDFNRGIEIKPGHYSEAYNNRGIAYLNQGDNISSCRDARKACELGNCKLLEVARGRGLCR